MLSIKCSSMSGANQDEWCKNKSWIFNLPVLFAEVRKQLIKNQKYGRFGSQ